MMRKLSAIAVVFCGLWSLAQAQVRYAPASTVRTAADCDTTACAQQNQICIEPVTGTGQGLPYICDTSTGFFTPWPGGAGGGAPISASYLTLDLNSTLTAERVFTCDPSLTCADTGANGTLTVKAPGPVDVRHASFGAVCNGTADDAQEIQAAIDSTDATGGKIRLPALNCGISVPLVLDDGQELEGTCVDQLNAGTICTRLTALATWAGTAMITDQGNGTTERGMAVRDMRIVGRTGVTNAIRFDNDEYALIERVKINQTDGAGIYLKDANGNVATIRDVNIDNAVKATSLAGRIGALTVEWNDSYVYGVDATTSSTDYSEAGKRVGLLISGGNNFISDSAGYISEDGVVVSGTLNRLMGIRADLNRGHGFVLETSGGNQIVGALSLRNGKQTTNTYDGFQINSTNNIIAASFAASNGSTEKHRYGFNNPGGAGNQFIGNKDLEAATAAFNGANTTIDGNLVMATTGATVDGIDIGAHAHTGGTGGAAIVEGSITFATNDGSRHDHHADDTTAGTLNAARIPTIDNAKLADMPGWSFKLRNAGTTGDPADAIYTDVATEATPLSGDWILGWDNLGQVRKYDVGTLPTGGGGEANTASNLGGGLANFDAKVGVDLRFNTFRALDFSLASNLLSFNRSLTLAGDPALGSEECVWTTDGPGGGGFLCEGSIVNAFEHLWLTPLPVDDVDTTQYFAVGDSAGKATAYGGSGSTTSEVDLGTAEVAGILDQAKMDANVVMDNEDNTYLAGTSQDYSAAKLRIPGSTSPPSADCDADGEAGRLHRDSDDGATGQVWVCGGAAAGWVPENLMRRVTAPDPNALPGFLEYVLTTTGENDCEGRIAAKFASGTECLATVDDVVSGPDDDVPESGDFGAGVDLEADGSVSANAVSNTKLSDMGAWTFKIRNAGTSGDPSDAALAGFTTDASPASGDFLIGFLDTGEIRKFDIGSLPGGGGGDNARAEDGDNLGTFTAMVDIDFDDSGDINFVRTAGPPDVLTGLIRTAAVSADELDETGVEAGLEAVLDLPDLQGLLSRAKGGLNLDTSAFGTGLFGSDVSNNTIDVDTEAELETALGGADVVVVATDDISSANLATLLSDETGSGAACFATSPVFTTSIAIPQAAAPTVDAAGEIAIDTTDVPATGGRDQLVVYDGAAPVTIPLTRTVCGTIENLAAADDNYIFWTAPYPVTVTSAYCVYQGTASTAATIDFQDGENNAMTMTDITCADGDSATRPTFQAITAANTLVAGESIQWTVTNAVAPETMKHTICINYTSQQQ